jgi:hypothetical protein
VICLGLWGFLGGFVLWGSFYGCALGSSCTVLSSLFPFSIKLLITYKKKK